jgi:glycosyltransferase involved in cell wall biosynthesis
LKRVAIFTTFYEAHSGFSLIAVAETQLRMLLDHGYDPVVLVQKGFKTTNEFWQPNMLDMRPVIPNMRLTSAVHDEFEERVRDIHAALRDNLADVDVCITHGVLALPMYQEHNVALRRYAQERPDLLWLHWLHSAPEHPHMDVYPQRCRSVCPPGYVVYPNESDLDLVRRAFRVEDKPERVVNCRAGHAQDPLLAWPYGDLTKKLVRGSDLLAGDVTAIYPVRMDRNKQVEVLLWLLAGVQDVGYEPRLLIVDWQSQGEKYLDYKRDLDVMVEDLGLDGKVHYSSRLDDRCNQGVPHQTVMELFDFTNVYFHPSQTETYSLVVHEAVMRGNIVYANGDFPAMRELYGDAVYYLPYGSRRHDRTYEPDQKTFWTDQAARVVSDLRINKAMWGKTRARQEWTPQALWKDFVPLLGLQPVEGHGHHDRDAWAGPDDLDKVGGARLYWGVEPSHSTVSVSPRDTAVQYPKSVMPA